jgi:6-phosphogluconolactonase
LLDVRRGEHVSLNLAMLADVTIEPVDALVRLFARRVADASKRAIEERGRFSMAVPGGSAAEILLPSLVGASIDWGKVDVFWVDERMVPADDPESNFRIAKAAWLDPASIPPERTHRLRGEDPLPAAEADYARILRERLGEPARIDFVVLGMGADGHVASLFPGHRLLRAWDRDVATLDDAPKPPSSRMTLTLRALNAARSVVLFATGEAKADAIAEVLGNEDCELPAALATMGAGHVSFLLDPAAAGKRPR